MNPLSQEDQRVLRSLVNQSPAVLREILYCNDQTAYSRAHTRRLYPTRGDLVTECFACYAEGRLTYLLDTCILPPL